MPDTDRTRARVVLAFDWGTSKIGVAVGQRVTGTASPLPPLRAIQGAPDWDEVERLIAAWQPDLFVVGIPYNMDGSDSDSSRRATRFARRLAGRFGIGWVGVDERLSTAEARGEAGAEEPVDSLAARLLAESWFRVDAAQAARG